MFIPVIRTCKIPLCQTRSPVKKRGKWQALRLRIQCSLSAVITLINSKMLRRKKTIIFRYFWCAESKSAVRFVLSRLEIDISAFHSVYSCSSPGILSNLDATMKSIIDKPLILIASHCSHCDAVNSIVLHNNIFKWYHRSVYTCV